MMRHWLAVCAVALVWLLVLGWAAGVPWSAPFAAREQIVLNGRDFNPVTGAGVDDGTALGIGATASDGNALQSIALEHVVASKLHILTYHFEDFPRTLELVLVFRRADSPEDVHTIELPWAGDGPTSVDLQIATPAWRGEIIELGFAEYATAQLVPPGIAFSPFRLVRAQLASAAWSSLPRLLRASWFGYQPWSLKAINVVGAVDDGGRSMAMVLLCGFLLSLAVCAWLLQWSRRRVSRALVGCALGAWVILDVRWLDDFSAKHRLTESIYAHKSWQQRVRLVPDEDIAGFAQLTRQQLTTAAVPQRILVDADSTYKLLRLIYFLLPLNAAPLESAITTAPASQWPHATVIVLCTSKRWHFDEARSALIDAERAIPVTPLFIGGRLGIFRLREPAR